MKAHSCCVPLMTLTKKNTFAYYLIYWKEIQDAINELFKVQTMPVWIWKTAGMKKGGAVEHLFFLAGSWQTSGPDSLCFKAAQLWKHFSPELWIDILHKLDWLQQQQKKLCTWNCLCCKSDLKLLFNNTSIEARFVNNT